MLIELKSTILIVALTSNIVNLAPLSAFAAIEKVEEYTESICSDYQGKWKGGSCNIKNEELEQEFMDDVASLEDSICDDDKPKDIDYEDWIDLCENINIFTN